MKPKGNGKFNRLLVTVLKEEFDKNFEKYYKKVQKNRFYNSFLQKSYRS